MNEGVWALATSVLISQSSRTMSAKAKAKDKFQKKSYCL